MMFRDPYLEEVMETTGLLFEEVSVLPADMIDFITRYMQSTLRQEIDKRSAYFATLDFQFQLMWLEKENIRPVNGQQSSPILCNWLGNFYSVLQVRSGFSSARLIKLFPAERLLWQSRTLHDLDVCVAVDRVLKAEGLSLRSDIYVD